VGALLHFPSLRTRGTYAFLLIFPLGSVPTDRAAVVYNAGDGAVFLLTSVYEFYEHILKIDIEIDIVLNYKNRIENRSFTKNLESSQHYLHCHIPMDSNAVSPKSEPLEFVGQVCKGQMPFLLPNQNCHQKLEIIKLTKQLIYVYFL